MYHIPYIGSTFVPFAQVQLRRPPRKGLVQGVAEAIWQICTVCSGVDNVEEVEEEACPVPKGMLCGRHP